MHTAELGAYGPQVEAALAALAERDAVNRIWAKDPTLWQSDGAHQAIIRNSLGWLGVTEFVRSRASELARFSTEAAQAGYTHVVLLGMGGSSLCADVLRLTFGSVPGHPRLHVLDTTDPASVRATESGIDLPRTLFIVASKSGTTPEIAAFHRYFFDRVREAAGDAAGLQFVAITDAGTALERSAGAAGFRHVFLNPADIGGRYSALSYFGMVPATLMGVDVLRLLDPAERMAGACRRAAPRENPGLLLGATLGALAMAGRDKVTFLCAPAIASFGYWVEQLIAESTGKEGLGIVPVEGETPGEPEVYGPDRVFVHLRLQGAADAGLDAAVARLRRAGHPILTITLAGAYDLGAEFFRWEFATAVAGAVLQIDPFDQPNVQESKDNTTRLLQGFKSAGKLPEGEPIAALGAVRLYADGPRAEPLRGARTLAAALKAHLGRVTPGDYVAFTAYLQATPPHAAALGAMRLAVRDALRVATTLGYGPRFLHSTGQLHKGGPDTGVFLQLTADDPVDAAIPGEPHTFGVMKAAQALGDLQSLQRRKRRALRLHIAGPVAPGLQEIAAAIREAVSSR